jgi:nitrous oxide reductase accessory protein NosL
VACGSADDGRDAPDLRAAPIAEQEGAVCGMLVRDQSAPRGQVVHRDGSRFFFCSVGDLLVHRSAPSPHGRVEATFVEVMDPAEDPGLPHTGEHAWSPAENVTYVIGVERQGIMGPPVLVYRDPETAARVVEAHPGASAIGFDELVAWWNEDQAR